MIGQFVQLQKQGVPAIEELTPKYCNQPMKRVAGWLAGTHTANIQASIKCSQKPWLTSHKNLHNHNKFDANVPINYQDLIQVPNVITYVLPIAICPSYDGSNT